MVSEKVKAYNEFARRMKAGGKEWRACPGCGKEFETFKNSPQDKKCVTCQINAHGGSNFKNRG